MKKADIIKKTKELASPQVLFNSFLFLLFAAALTFTLVSKYIFFQTIVDTDNTSKVTVTAPKAIEVTDIIKTEKKKKEVSNQVSVIYKPADNIYIKNNLNELISEITAIRKKEISDKEKRLNLETKFDLSENSSKQYIFSFLISGADEDIAKVFLSAENTLSAVLNEGITEKDFTEDTNNIPQLIRKNIEEGVSKNHAKVITALLEQVIAPNMIVDEEATELAKKTKRSSVKPVIIKFNKGDVIVKTGELITQVKKDALAAAGYNILRINYSGIFGIFCITAAGIFSVLLYIKLFEPKFLNRRHLSIAAVLSLLTAAAAALLPQDISVFALPIPFLYIMLSVFFNPRCSFFITAALLTIITLSLQFSALAMSVFLLSVIISASGINKLHYTRRFDIIKAGCFISIAIVMTILCVYYDLNAEKLGNELAAGALNGFLSGIFALGMIPVVENIFKVITSFGLAELCDYNQPLLRRLHETAPGTFEHSLRVSNLAETAAEAIGADPVLARAGALYHDAGKIVRPLFFIENQTFSGIENPHDKLTPRSSKMIITSHTKDGLALAKEYHLPEVIQEFIARHHGDSLASYFYNQAAAEEGAENVSEEQFRYTGPKPNTKETAVLMIADAVESASRTLKDHSQEELDALINKIIKDRIDDHQFDDSPLTLKDIKIIASTLSRVLRSVFHKRIKYQDTVEELKNKDNPPPEKQGQQERNDNP